MAIYEFKTRIRYTEINEAGYLTETALLDLFQSCSTFQSEDIGLGIEHLRSLNRAWVLSSWQIVINSLPYFGEEVTVQTWSYGIKYSLGYRNFRLLSSKGEVLAIANTLWVYLDTNTYMPVKCPPEESEKYGCDPQIEMKWSNRKITLPEILTPQSDFEVVHYFIDTNNHMNNAKYILAARQYIPADATVREIKAEYKKSAQLHDIIHPYTHYDNNTYTVALLDDDGNTYATVQFVV